MTGCGKSGPGGGTTAANPSGPISLESKSGYHAVYMTNGQVVFGKLSGLGSAYPVMEDVYYVRAVPDKDTKEVRNMLVKRGQEWHSPDKMVINAQHILFVESVGDKSRVQELIAGMKAVGK